MGFLKKIIFSFAFLAVLVPNFALAEDFGLNDAAPPALTKGIAGQTGVAGVVGAIIKAVLGMVGILFFLIIVYAGLTWMIARGNTEKVDKSKDMIEGAVIGLIIILAAYAITKFVFENLDRGAAVDSSICAGKGDGTTCGDNRFCKDSVCIMDCESQGGTCGLPSKCADLNRVRTGICPGAVNNVCCLP